MNICGICRLYHANEGKITVRCSVTVAGDLTVALYHARNTFGGIGRPQNIKICQFQMHTGFIAEDETLIHIDRSELDELLDDENIPQNFNVSIPIEVGGEANSRAPWSDSRKSDRNPLTLFSSPIEYEETVDNFGKFNYCAIETILISYENVIILCISSHQTIFEAAIEQTATKTS